MFSFSSLPFEDLFLLEINFLLLFQMRFKNVGIINVIIIQIAVTTLSTAIVPAYKIPFF